MDELLDSLAKSSDSAVGPDDIHYQMLKHLPSDALQSLLNTLNDIWLTGNFPPSWHQSHIVPILVTLVNKKLVADTFATHAHGK